MAQNTPEPGRLLAAVPGSGSRRNHSASNVLILELEVPSAARLARGDLEVIGWGLLWCRFSEPVLAVAILTGLLVFALELVTAMRPRSFTIKAKLLKVCEFEVEVRDPQSPKDDPPGEDKTA